MKFLTDTLFFATPLLWLGLALVLGIIEMTTFTFFLIWPALASVLMAILIWVMPDISFVYQIIFFSVLSVALTIPGRKWVHPNHPDKDKAFTLNDRTTAMIGMTGKVVACDGKTGRIVIHEAYWDAKWRSHTNARPGDSVRVVDASQQTLIVEGVDPTG